MMQIDLDLASRQLRADVWIQRLDQHVSEPGYAKFYSGTKPDPGSVDFAGDVFLQATVTFEKPCGEVFTDEEEGIVRFQLFIPVEGARVDNEAITWVRFFDGSNGWVCDMDVSDLAGSGACKIDAVTGYTGSFVRIIVARFNE